MNNIVYADTVGIDEVVYPTIGENIRNSSMLMNAKEIIRLKITLNENNISSEPPIIRNLHSYISLQNKNIFLIRVLNINVTGDDVSGFLGMAQIDNKLCIKLRSTGSKILNGTIDMLVGVI